MDQSTGLHFGFIEQDLITALDENQPWKERTNAMDEVESLTERLILVEKADQSIRMKLCEKYAWDFLGFTSRFVTDINFKISLSAIKIVQLLFLEVSAAKKPVRIHSISVRLLFVVLNHRYCGPPTWASTLRWAPLPPTNATFRRW